MGHAEGHNPFHVLNVGETTYNREPVMYFYLCPLNGGTCLSQTAPSPFIPYGSAWTHVEAQYVCAADNTGRVTIWQDGHQVFDVSGPTRYAGGNCEWSVNNYSNGLNPTPTPIYVDDCGRCRDLSGRSLHRLTGEGASGKTRTARPLANPEEREAELRGKGR